MLTKENLSEKGNILSNKCTMSKISYLPLNSSVFIYFFIFVLTLT